MNKKLGRPKIEIDWEQFDKLCGLQAPLREIAAWFDCSEDTIENICKREKDMLFSDYFDLKRGRGKISIRRKQYEMAMGGNVALLIWLGKQWLDQRDQMVFAIEKIPDEQLANEAQRRLEHGIKK